MSSAPVRRVSPKDIQVVQNLIERCLQLYMNQREVVETLLAQAKIEPGFTELVWQKLEEENKEFFKAYYARLMVKRQIIEFNKLLEQQVQLMRQINPSAVGPIRTSNGSHIPHLHQNSACYAPDHTGPALKAEIHQSMASGLPNAFTNGSSSLHSAMHAAVEMSSHANRIDTPGNMLPMQSSNMGLLQGMNGAMIKSEAGYSSNSPYLFGADGSVLETRQSIADVSVTSFSSVESNSQALNNEPLIDVDTSSFGFLGQIPRNFSLSDLTADFAQSSDILENYPRSPFVGTDNENFLDSHDRENQAESKRLDTISEGVSYDDFGSE